MQLTNQDVRDLRATINTLIIEEWSYVRKLERRAVSPYIVEIAEQRARRLEKLRRRLIEFPTDEQEANNG